MPSSGIYQESGGEIKVAKPKTPSEDWFDRIRAKLNDFIRLPEQTTKKVVAKGYGKGRRGPKAFEDLVARIKDMELRQKQWAARDRPPR